MKKRFWTILTLSVLCMVLGVAAACSKSPSKPKDPEDNPPVPPPAEKVELDLMLFIGGSNMAGRGDAESATAVAEGHAYEFRAISDPSKLYPLTEPFGAEENNDASGVSEPQKKTGSLVSAFCESYYAATKTPVLAVSCSKGETPISFWDTSTQAYADACNRMLAAYAFLDESEDYSLRDAYVVWLQGEADGDRGTAASSYTEAMSRIFEGFLSDLGVKQCFVISVGGYFGADGAREEGYTAIRNAQTEFCETSDLATAVSVQLEDLSDLGLMKEGADFTQEAYEIVGSDAGANAAFYAKNGEKPQCKHYTAAPAEPLKQGGAWLEKGGTVVIPAAAALEYSQYASATDAYDGSTHYRWEEMPGTLSGVRLLPNGEKQWERGSGMKSAPQLTYEIEFEETGTYDLYVLASYPDTASNSILAGLDGKFVFYCSTPVYGAGIWQGEADRTEGDPWCFEIETAGRHTFTIAPREDGVILHQFVLTKDKEGTFERYAALEESDRGPVEQHGIYLEFGGSLTVDLFDAFDGDEYASAAGASKDGTAFYWQRSLNGRGVQLMPNSGTSWSDSEAQSAPKLTYKADFQTAGEYRVFLYGSSPDASSDSVYLALDDGAPVPLTRSTSGSGTDRWLTGDTWNITVPEAGVHTLTVFAREDGLTFHKLYLTQDKGAKVGALDPAISPRSLESSLTKDHIYLAAAAFEGGTYTLTAPADGTYDVYGGGEVDAGGGIAVSVGGTLTGTVTASGRTKLGTVTLKAGQTYEIGLEEVSARVTGVCLVAEKGTASVETLVFGDSYTDTLFWQDFYTQLAEIGAKTIGISGTHVDIWPNRVPDIALYAPRNIVIHIGVNDIDGGETAQSCSSAIIALIGSLRAALPEANIFYISICNNVRFEDKWEVYGQSNAAVKAYTESAEGVYFIDYAALVEKMDDTWENRGFLSDNLHPSPEAYAALSQLVKDSVKAVYTLNDAVDNYLHQLEQKYTGDYEMAERVEQAYRDGVSALRLCKTAEAAQQAYEAALSAMQNAYETQVLIDVTYKGPFGNVLQKVSGVYDVDAAYSFISPTYLGLTADQAKVEGTAEQDESFTVTYSAAGTDADYLDGEGQTVERGTRVPAYDEKNQNDNDFLYTTGSPAFVFGNAGVTGDFAATLFLNTKFEPTSNSGSATEARTARLFLVDAANDGSYWSFSFLYTHCISDNSVKLGVKNGTRKTETTIPDKNTAIALMRNSDILLTIVREGNDVKWQAIVIGGEGTGFEGEVYTTTCTLPNVTAEGLKIAVSNVAYAEYTVRGLKTSREKLPKLTVTYTDEWNNTLSVYSESLPAGGAYRVESPAYLGYTADKETVEGTLQNDTAVTVRYSFGGSEQVTHSDKDGRPIVNGTEVEAYSGADSVDWDHTGDTFKTYLGGKEGFAGDFAVTVRINSKFVSCDNKTSAGNNSTVRLYLRDASASANYWLFSFPYSYRVSGGNKLGCSTSKYENEAPVTEAVAKEFFLDCDVTLTVVREGGTLQWQAIVIGGDASAHAGESYVMACTLENVSAESIQFALTNRAYSAYTVSSAWKK